MSTEAVNPLPLARRLRRAAIGGAIAGGGIALLLVAVDFPQVRLTAVAAALLVFAGTGAVTGALGATLMWFGDRMLDRAFPEPQTAEEQQLRRARARLIVQHYAEPAILVLFAFTLLAYAGNVGDLDALLRGQVQDQRVDSLVAIALGITTASRALAEVARGVAGHLRDNLAQLQAGPDDEEPHSEDPR